MKQGYILSLNDWVRSLTKNIYDDYYNKGLALKNKNKKMTEVKIWQYAKSKTTFDAETIAEDFFAEFDADVFISHSHANINPVTAFAGYLKSIGARPFVDSLVWRDAYNLLWELNNTYSRNDDGDLDYDDVAYTAAQIYMILNGALIDMMDRTKYFVFLGTEESIQNGKTTSPWIYSELLYSKVLCPRQAIFEHADMSFPAFTDHLEQLDVHRIEQVLGKRKSVYG